MGTIPATTYGPGGFDPAKSDKNVVESRSVTTPVAQDNADTLHQRAKAALATNAAYVALASPTAAQTTAQVKTLSRECSALIRLLLSLLDDITDTQ